LISNETSYRARLILKTMDFSWHAFQLVLALQNSFIELLLIYIGF
jgi:hypothetical protein